LDLRAIPIGIDPQEFQPQEPTPAADSLKVLFVGNFRHTPNVEAANLIATEIAPYFPQIQFVLVGDQLPEGFDAPVNVLRAGYVSDLRQLYRRPNTIFIAPLFSGTGQRVKLLEALSMSCPVIATSVAAFGYPISSGREAFIANSAVQFREALAQLVSSEKLRMEMGAAGREMIRKHLDWSQIGQRLLDAVTP
jgi:glycosyltransferase involved in cell wall biosynthesis